jgi:sec-independent protein translocase protein TatB
MFNIGPAEMAEILVIGLLVVGPERLPKYAADAARMLRQLRRMAENASTDLRSELGPEFADVDLADLHPKRFVRKHLLEGYDDDDSVQADRSAAGGALEPGERPPYDADAT